MGKDKISKALKLCQQSFTGVAVFSAVGNILMLVPAFFMLNVYDKAVANNSLPTLWMLSGITAFLFIILACMETLRSRLLVAISSRLDCALTPDLYKITLEAAALSSKSRVSTQPLLDINALRQFLTGAGIFAIFDAPWLPIYLLILFLFHPLLGWLGVLATVVLLVLAVVNQYRTSPALAAANELARQNNTDTMLNLRNAEAIEAMGMGAAVEARWRQKQDQLLRLQESGSHTAGLFAAITKTLRLAVQSAAIAAGAFLVLKQEISPGMLIAGSILIGRALQPVEVAVGAWKGFIEAKEQYLRLRKVLDTAPPPREQMSLPAIKGRVTANQATIIPPGSREPVLQGLTLEIPPGSVCMVVGPSGSGKSSFVRSVLGLWPCLAGDIRIDGADSSKYNREELGPQLGYLPQDIELLEGTVSANICRFGVVDSDAVIRAAQDAGLHDYILSLPNGYDTELGKEGGQLSPGQRQRIALARAVYRRPKLVILDEPNSNLDEFGEKALNSAIQTLKANGSTVILVSHRQTVLPLADLLMVLARGRLKEFGPVAEVVKNLKAGGQPKTSPSEPRALTVPATVPAANVLMPSKKPMEEEPSK